MIKIEFICGVSEKDAVKVNLEDPNGITLDEALTLFKGALLASGFVFDPCTENLAIVSDIVEEEDDCNDDYIPPHNQDDEPVQMSEEDEQYWNDVWNQKNSQWVTETIQLVSD